MIDRLRVRLEVSGTPPQVLSVAVPTCRAAVVSRVVGKMKMAHSSGWTTTNPSPCRATTGGTRRGQGYQEADAGA